MHPDSFPKPSRSTLMMEALNNLRILNPQTPELKRTKEMLEREIAKELQTKFNLNEDKPK